MARSHYFRRISPDKIPSLIGEKERRWYFVIPYSLMAAVCSDVPYPLLLYHIYCGKRSWSFSINRSRSVLATMDAAATEMLRESARSTKIECGPPRLYRCQESRLSSTTAATSAGRRVSRQVSKASTRARRRASAMPMLSTTFWVEYPTPTATAPSMMRSCSRSRFRRVSFLLSSRSANHRASAGKTTAAAITGPARAPTPTSSTPATKRSGTPALSRTFFSRSKDGKFWAYTGVVCLSDFEEDISVMAFRSGLNCH